MYAYDKPFMPNEESQTNQKIHFYKSFEDNELIEIPKDSIMGKMI